MNSACLFVLLFDPKDRVVCSEMSTPHLIQEGGTLPRLKVLKRRELRKIFGNNRKILHNEELHNS
jgi:hypothetical protein